MNDKAKAETVEKDVVRYKTVSARIPAELAEKMEEYGWENRLRSNSAIIEKILTDTLG